MARYEINKWSEYQEVKDNETEKMMSQQEVCDLLNAHAGMKTREWVENRLNTCREDVKEHRSGDAQYYVERGFISAYLNVLNRSE